MMMTRLLKKKGIFGKSLVNKKIKVVFRNGWVYVNGKVAQLFTPLREVEAGDGLVGALGRVVYESDGILIKFDDSHWHQTKNEIKIWQMMDSQDRKYFGQVVGWDINGEWIAVKKEEINKDSDLSDENSMILRYLIDKYKLEDIYEDINNNRTTRKKDGSLIIYDWGLQTKKKRRAKQ